MALIIFLFAVFSVGIHALAPILGVENAKSVADSYIVVLKTGVSNTALASHLDWANGILETANVSRSTAFEFGTFRGYSIQAPKDVASKLAQSDHIEYIEADQSIQIPSVSLVRSRMLKVRDVQANAPWGLARISHRKKGSTDYVFVPTNGTYIYVLDTGVRITHQLFEGRASYGFNAVGGSDNDGNGHGTHVAGIASSQTYGVARFSNIISVKILDDGGSGTMTNLISGINWAVQDMQSKGRVGSATAALTAGGGFSSALNQAVASASNAGLFFAVVAGSENTDARNISPGSEPAACTVGSTTIDDAKMSSSNYGPTVDIFAPGQGIPSLWITSDASVATLSGTSTAAAHIAGLGAYFLALEGPRGAVELCERLREVATKDALSGIPVGTSNLLAYNLSGL